MSSQSDTIWAKSSEETRWLPLWMHLEDSLNVSQILWREWVPTRIQNIISEDLRLHPDEAGRVLTWLAGMHDLGKATPDFSGRDGVIYMTSFLHSRMLEAGYTFSSVFNGRGNTETRYRHELAGCVLLDNIVDNDPGYGEDEAGTVDVIVAGHHGSPVELDVRTALSLDRDINRVKETLWGESIEEIFDYINSKIPEGQSLVSQLRKQGVPQRSQVLLTSLVIMSDWVASSEEFFELLPNAMVPRMGVDTFPERYERHVSDFNIPARFTPKPLDKDTDWLNLFKERFQLENAQLHPVQEALYELVATVDDPEDIFIVEAPMGAGKTEAALIASEILNSRTQGSGVFFGLPTMATTEAIFTRVSKYLESYSQEKVVTLALNHSKASLSENYDKQRVSTRSNSEGVVPEGWFHGSRMRLLNSFVVGTIDSFLMLSLKVKYSYWRHLGLAGKAIILDEVHAADTYMMQYLKRSLEWAGFYGNPVILLSATLDEQTRAALLAAYQKGKQERLKLT